MTPSLYIYIGKQKYINKSLPKRAYQPVIIWLVLDWQMLITHSSNLNNKNGNNKPERVDTKC